MKHQNQRIFSGKPYILSLLYTVLVELRNLDGAVIFLREIKFRAKLLDSKVDKIKDLKWVYGSYVIRNMGSSKVEVIFDCDTGEMYNIHSDTIGQFTGLHDKNPQYKKRNEIYEGDIIKDGIWIYLCKYEDGAFIAEIINNEGVTGSGRTLLNSVVSCGLSEVIGNVYENPEFLRVEDA
jgi:uncharacterized phage protein (TIGR01671 family)